MSISTTSRVNPRKYPTAKEAQEAAMMEAASTAGLLLPAVMFQQGQRSMLATALPMPHVRRRLQVNSAPARGGVDEVRGMTNRPIMSDHVASIKGYLQENVGKRYILPPVTLNVRQAINVYMPDYPSTLTSVWIVVPGNTRLEITDGAHRAAAADKVASALNDDQLELFDQDGVCVMITMEENLDQIHQDFADASKTKALPKSQLAAYDRRNPANGMVIDLIERCPVFKGKIDSTSKTLSKKSTKLFLTNQVRQMIKELLVGQYAMPDAVFEAQAKNLLGSADTPNYIAARDQYVGFVNRVAQAIPVWREIANLPEGGVQHAKITDLRSQGLICLTATGLVLIGRIGHELIKNNAAWDDYADRLGSAIDWNRDAEIWQGNIVSGGKIQNQQAPVRRGFEAVCAKIGLTIPEKKSHVPEAVAA
jgi:DNA sulfur modification protein DndB